MRSSVQSGMTHGPDRSQTLLLPEAVDDYVGPDNPVRFIDAFVALQGQAADATGGQSDARTGAADRRSVSEADHPASADEAAPPGLIGRQRHQAIRQRGERGNRAAATNGAASDPLAFGIRRSCHPTLRR
jgi:hypothetical protein